MQNERPERRPRVVKDLNRLSRPLRIWEWRSGDPHLITVPLENKGTVSGVILIFDEAQGLSDETLEFIHFEVHFWIPSPFICKGVKHGPAAHPAGMKMG